MAYEYDALRRALVTQDSRLTRLLQRDPERCASVSEYAAATGIDTVNIMELFGDAVNDGVLGFEIWAEEIFVHTAPSGRPVAPNLPEVAANLWERLRFSGSVEEAYSLWRIVRALELAGWKVEANPHRIMFGLAALPAGCQPVLGIRIMNSIVPLIVHPTREQVAHPQGLLTMFAQAGASIAGILCDSGALDEMVTAVRRWDFTTASATGMSVIIFEGPRYAPTLLRPNDASVAARAVSQDVLSRLTHDTRSM